MDFPGCLVVKTLFPLQRVGVHMLPWHNPEINNKKEKKVKAKNIQEDHRRTR